MQLGFLLGICAAFLWSIVNLIDKYLVERIGKDTGIGALIILSSLFPAVLLPISFFLADMHLDLSFTDICILICSGLLTTVWISFYLLALESEETSVVVPLIFQLTPLFALPLAFMFLHELPSTLQLAAGGIIVAGSLVLGYERSTGTLKVKLLLLVTASAVAVALMNTLFKLVAEDAPFWTSMFWHVCGITLAGTFLFVFHTRYRAQFKAFLKENMGLGLSLNAVSETITLIGDILFSYAILLAPLALVQTTEAFQPIFVFFFSLALTLVAPSLIREDFSRAAVLQKVTGIALVVCGSMYLMQL